MKPRRVFGYIRVSSQDQGRHGTSLDGQRDEVNAYCAREGYPAPQLFVEVESAGAEKLERRTELKRLLSEATAGDLVLVAKQDRWSRDTLFYLQSTRDLAARAVRFFSLAERFDPSTSEGRFSATVMAAVAEQERDRIKSRTVGRKRELRAQGLYVEGRIPFGYRRAGRRLEIVEEEAIYVREAFRLCIAGRSLREIGDEFEVAIGGSWKIWRVHHLLKNRIYLGEISTPEGNVTRGTHDPIVDALTFDRAQVELERRMWGGRKAGHSEARTCNWLMAGIATCAKCGSRMGPAYGNNQMYYYACCGRRAGRGCAARYVRVDVADPVVAEGVFERLVSLRHELAHPAKAAAVGRPAKGTTIEARKKKLEAALDRATQGFVDGLLSADELRAQRDRIGKELAAIDAEVEALSCAPKAITSVARAELLERVEAIRESWDAVTAPDRKKVLSLLATSVRLSADDGPRIEWRSVEELAEDVGGSSHE